MLKSPCTVAQAMSALVKSVRLRHTQDACYWYMHIVVHFPDARFRLTRRMLIIAAEDCFSLEAQAKARAWFKIALSKTSDPKDIDALALVLLHSICNTENWWQNAGGQQYIAHWRKAEVVSNTTGLNPEYFSGEQIVDDIVGAAKAARAVGGTPLPAMMLHMLGCGNGMSRKVYAAALVVGACEVGDLGARLTAQTHLSNATLLGNMDDNWLGHSLWRLCGQPFEPAILGHALPRGTEFGSLRDLHAEEAMSAPRKPPLWTQDGIHCSGKDKRFAGLLTSMTACCVMFNRHNRLDPNDAFTPDVYDHALILGESN